MKRLKSVALFAIVFGLLFQTLFASNLLDDLQQMAEANAKGYVTPIATGLGMSLNSGIYRTAKVHKLLGFDIAVNFSGFAVPNDKTTYTFIPPNVNFSYQGTEISLDGSQLYPGDQKAQTFFGKKDATTITADKNYAQNAIKSQLGNAITDQQAADLANQYATDLSVPGGIGFRYGGFPSAQAALGLPMGTELQVRYTPKINLGKRYGDFSVVGGGLRISIDQFIPIPLFPVDIATGVFFQKSEIGPLTLNNSIFHAEVSRGLPLITIYGGLAYEKSTLKVDYTLDDVPNNPILNGQQINFKIDGDNTVRATVGARFKILVFNLNADYSIGTYSVVNLGLGLSFR